MKKLRVLIAAGGTGGHVFPAISIADALKGKENVEEIAFVGTREKMEWVAVPKAGYKIFPVWISGFHRQLTFKNLMFPIKLIRALAQSKEIIKEFRPDMVISCGGYAAGPVSWVAERNGIPVFIQEQNSFPGVTNRLLAKRARRIFTAFPEAVKWFGKEKVVLCGNPTRQSLQKERGKEAFEHFGFSKDKPTLLILGGSGGARSINEAVKTHLETLHTELGLQILWQCGTRYYDRLKTQIDMNAYPNLRLMDFIDAMPEAYHVASLVISRAGASSCAELMITGKASILVPSPNVAGDHQTANARSMVAQGAAVMVNDEEIGKTISVEVGELFQHSEKLRQMEQAALAMSRPDAASEIADLMLKEMEELDA